MKLRKLSQNTNQRRTDDDHRVHSSRDFDSHRAVPEVPEVVEGRMVDSFDPIVKKARDLGFRMAQAGFSEEDNPYTGAFPRLSRDWNEGFRVHKLIKAWESKDEGSYPRLVSR